MSERGEMPEGEDTMAVAVRHRRFTLDEYHRMGEVGILGEDDRVELVEGEIVEMTPIGSEHAAAVERIREVLARRLGDRAQVWTQNPVVLRALTSEPQPDVMVLVRRADFYVRALPEPPDVHLIIEVADSSLAYDRRTKLPLYARAGIAEVWLVDLPQRRIELHRAPGATGYGDVAIPDRDEPFAPRAFPDLTVTVATLLG